MSAQVSIRRFRTMGLLTIFVVYTLILVGGIVRTTGSGMGCPDWPTCFGQWIPPVSESDLPANYQQIYADRGYLETEFNVTKTWIEYANRLLGVTTGFLILLTVGFSFRFLKIDKPVFWFSFAAFILVAFQGWLGSRVVASNLMPGMITAHMITAQVIVGLLIYAIVRSQKGLLANVEIGVVPKSFPLLLKVVMGMTLLQMTMGTQVREAVDIIAHQMDYSSREQWIERLPIIFLIHRSFSSLILFTNLWLIWCLIKSVNRSSLLYRLAFVLLGLIVSTILLGVVMDRLHVPAFAQPFHMWLASLIFGTQFFIYMNYRYASQSRASLTSPS